MKKKLIATLIIGTAFMFVGCGINLTCIMCGEDIGQMSSLSDLTSPICENCSEQLSSVKEGFEEIKNYIEEHGDEIDFENFNPEGFDDISIPELPEDTFEGNTDIIVDIFDYTIDITKLNGMLVKGFQVRNAIEVFADTDTAVFVHTLNMGGSNDGNSGLELLRLLREDQDSWQITPHKNDCPDAIGQWSYLWEFDGVTADTNTGTTVDKDVLFVNYAALLSTEGVFTFKDGGIVFNKGLATENHLTVYNNDDTYIGKVGAPEYIPFSALFVTYVINDEEGNDIGLMFVERKTY